MSDWWQTGVVYQVYPRSFQDTNGDGVGDLPGILRRLDYLQWLGIDALWISPIYPSPMADFGYDVSNYVDIHPLFGTLADMDALIAGAHARRLKIILDFVPNHTSDQHPWFLDARSSRSSHRRDWYIWRDPAPGAGPPHRRPPTNWLSRFDGRSAWEWDEATEQFYLHSFLKEQPDLNWRTPAVREAMLDVMRFWFERGVDGFRVDVSYRVMKDAEFRNNPPDEAWRPGMEPAKRLLETYTKNTPGIHQFNRWLRQVADAYPDRVLIGEINLPFRELVTHYGADDEFHLPFNFSLINAPWNPKYIRQLAEQYEALLPAGAWPNWVLGNHDQHRVASRLGLDQARVAMTLLLTLRGTPTLYYGDELAMVDGRIPPDRVQDPWEKLTPGLGLGRDPERTPMQWDDSPNAGFCPPGVTPWLPVNEDHAEKNVALQRRQTASMLAMTRRLLSLRKAHPALHGGSFKALNAPAGLLAYARETENEAVLVVLNFTAGELAWTLPGRWRQVKPLFSSLADRDSGAAATLTLQPHEAVLLAAGSLAA